MGHSGFWRVAGRAPQCIRLARGDCLTCVQGLAWVTQASSDRDIAGRDIVLGPRERFCPTEAVWCFVSALRGQPVCIAVDAGSTAAWPASRPRTTEIPT